MKPVALLVLMALLQLPGRVAHAQTDLTPTTAAAPAAPPHLILVTINWWSSRFGSDYLTAEFDTNGQGLANMSQVDLNKKYAKVKLPASPAAIINFVVQSGYRVVSFTTTQGGAGADVSRYSVTNGYVFLCEQVR